LVASPTRLPPDTPQQAKLTQLLKAAYTQPMLN
jgi:hypothetical protein